MIARPARRGGKVTDSAAHTSDALLPVDEALSELLQHASPVSDIDVVETIHALGRVLATDLVADVDVPGHANSAMDGFAVHSQDTRDQTVTSLRINQRITPGTKGQALLHGCAARIFTGAPIPPVADAVVAQEECSIQNANVLIQRRVNPNENIRPRGNDITAGSVILEQGTKIRPQEMALAAAVGLASLPLYRRPVVAIFSTGDELQDPGTALRAAHVYDSNRYGLSGLLQALNCETRDLGIIPDNISATRDTLAQAAGNADLIITTGGVSVGEEDYVKTAIEELGTLEVWRIAIKPGKPLAFGTVNDTPIFGLPGNPVASCVTFLLFVCPFLKRTQGITNVAINPAQVPADFVWCRARKRREYVRARLCEGPDGNMIARLYPQQGSDILSSMTWADGLVEIRENELIQRGEPVRFIPFSQFLA